MGEDNQDSKEQSKIVEFNFDEITELIELFNKKNLESYAFKIFNRLKELGKGKYDFIDNDLYYETLAPLFASFLPVYPPVDNTRLSFEEMIKSDIISLSVLLDETYEAKQ